MQPAKQPQTERDISDMRLKPFERQSSERLNPGNLTQNTDNL